MDETSSKLQCRVYTLNQLVSEREIHTRVGGVVTTIKLIDPTMYSFYDHSGKKEVVPSVTPTYFMYSLSPGFKIELLEKEPRWEL